MTGQGAFVPWSEARSKSACFSRRSRSEASVKHHFCDRLRHLLPFSSSPPILGFRGKSYPLLLLLLLSSSSNFSSLYDFFLFFSPLLWYLFSSLFSRLLFFQSISLLLFSSIFYYSLFSSFFGILEDRILLPLWFGFKFA